MSRSSVFTIEGGRGTPPFFQCLVGYWVLKIPGFDLLSKSERIETCNCPRSYKVCRPPMFLVFFVQPDRTSELYPEVLETDPTNHSQKRIHSCQTLLILSIDKKNITCLWLCLSSFHFFVFVQRLFPCLLRDLWLRLLSFYTLDGLSINFYWEYSHKLFYSFCYVLVWLLKLFLYLFRGLSLEPRLIILLTCFCFWFILCDLLIF